jgi:hypothetical protein
MAFLRRRPLRQAAQSRNGSADHFPSRHFLAPSRKRDGDVREAALHREPKWSASAILRFASAAFAFRFAVQALAARRLLSPRRPRWARSVRLKEARHDDRSRRDQL